MGEAPVHGHRVVRHDHAVGELALQCGQPTRGLRLRCEIHGALDPARSNAILFPTWFGGRHPHNRWIIGSGRALDTDRYCVIVVNALGNGESSSPSNDPQLMAGRQPVAVSLYDNVRAQADLVHGLGITRLHAVIGRSMGAQQALQWGCLFPGRVQRVFAFCGLPRTTPHNQAVLQAMEDVLLFGADRPEHAVTLAARIYAGWSLSSAFFSQRFGGSAAACAAEWIEQNIVRNLQTFGLHDLLTLIRTWKSADVSANPVFGGDLRAALGACAARTLLLTISHDLLFPPADFDQALHGLPAAELRALHSVWGHRAAAPGGSEQDIAVLESTLGSFLQAVA